MGERPPRVRRETSKPGGIWVLAGALIPLFHVVATLKVVGRENIPAQGPFIFAPNHNSDVDPIVTGTAIFESGRVPRFMAKASLFRLPVVGWALKGAGQIPVERGGSRAGVPLEVARRVVGKGEMVIMYPEGSMTRDPDLWPMRGKTGAARLALATGIPVIPAAHWGTQNLMAINTNRLHLWPRPKITIKIGPPVDLKDLEARATETSAQQEATVRIMAAITALLEDLRGERAPAERWDPSKHGQSETGRF